MKIVGLNLNARWTRNIQKFWVILAENGLLTVLEILSAKFLQRKKPLAIRFMSRSLYIRPGTPDLNVAFSCFSGEFQELSNYIGEDEVGIIIDAGGYIGTSAIALAEMFPCAKVVAIEPDAANYSILTRNVEHYERISSINAALVPHETDEQFVVEDRGAGEWGLVTSKLLQPKEGDQLVSAVTIDQILREAGGSDVLCIKMDIEGAEREMLTNSTAWLTKTKALMIELHPDIYPDIQSIFEVACHEREIKKSSGEKFISVKSRSAKEAV